MKHQPKAVHCKHCVIPSAHVWSAPQWRAVSRAAGELLNHSTTKLFHRAVHQQHSQLSKGCQQHCSIASRDMETITSKPLAIPTPKAAKCL